MNKKKILIFIDWYLPGYKAGGPIRSCANFVSHFSSEYDFFIVTRDTDYMDSVPYPDVRKNNWTITDASNVFYVSNKNLTKDTFKKIISEINPDIVYLNGIFSYFFTILPLKIVFKNIKVIIAVRGMLAPGALSIKPIKKKIFFLYSKMIGLFDKVIFQVSSLEEKMQTEKIFPASQIIIAPNLPRKKLYSDNNNLIKKSGELRLINIARISPEKNLYFALQVLKKVKGNIVFDFYGPIYDKLYWEKCKTELNLLPANVRVSYKGVAKDYDIFNILKQYHFLFLPSLGENFGHIILESLSSSIPVIIGNNTPWTNLNKQNAGWDISLSNIVQFIETIDKCYEMNSDEYESYSKGAAKEAMSYINDEEKLNATRKLFS